MGRRRQRVKALSPDRVEAKRVRDLLDTATLVGLPEAQRQPSRLAIVTVPQIGNAPTPIKQTVRKLTRIELLSRSGLLEPHEAAACELYAGWHEAGFEAGLGVTANYAGRSGGGAQNPDHLARHKAQMLARDDFLDAQAQLQRAVPAAYVSIFHRVVIHGDTISGIAIDAFMELQQSRARQRTAAAVRLCANALGALLAPRLPIDAMPVTKARPAPAMPPAVTDAQPEIPPLQQVTAAIAASLERADAQGRRIEAIAVARMTRSAIARELASGRAEVSHFQGLPLVERAGWTWGYLLVDAPA